MPIDAPTDTGRCSQWQFYWLPLLLIIALLPVLGGCVTATVTPEPVFIREPRVAQIPLVVGVYYSDAFRELVYAQQGGPLIRHSFAIGGGSIKLIDEALALLFKQVVLLPGPLSPGASPPNVAGVIEPSISTVNLRHPPLGQTPSSGPFWMRTSIAYAFTLSTPEGERLAAWEVEGDGVHIFGFENWNTAVKDSFERAMREAGWKLVSGFRDIPDVARWLELHGAK